MNEGGTEQREQGMVEPNTSREGPHPASGEQVVLKSTPVPTEVPARVLIAPWGRVASANGMFVMDEAAGEAVLDAFREHGTDIPVDYEHQSLGGAYASPNGQAPAAGWIRALQVCRPGEEADPGLYADIEWTESARSRLAAREYRYLSPVVLVCKADRRVRALHSVALTNKPAIVGMRPIVNRESTGQSASTASPAGALPVATAAEATAVQAAVPQSPAIDGLLPTAIGNRFEGDRAEALERLRLRLGLSTECAPTAIIAAAEERLESLTNELARRTARDRVEAAFLAGKLTGAQQEWAMQLAMKDAACFDAWVMHAPVLVHSGKTEPPTGGEALTRQRRTAAARAEFRTQPALALLTSEEAWVREALRECEAEAED